MPAGRLRLCGGGAFRMDVAALALVVSGAAAILATGQSQSTASGPSLPEGQGRELFQQSCSPCHGVGLATGKRRSSDEWAAVIQRMIGLGVQLDESQAATVRTYLATHFGRHDDAISSSSEAPATFPRPSGVNQWPAYGGGGENKNFSPLTQITPQNVARLRKAWTFRYGLGQSEQGEQGYDSRFEITPLLIGGVMYISTPGSPLKPQLKSTVTALLPETGEVLWRFESPANIHGRGLAYWPGDANTAPRLIFATDGGLLMAVDVTTGQLARSFGRRGQIDVYIGVASEIVGESRRSTYTVPNPVTIYKDLIITGARPGESGPPQPRGDIRAFDARTGRLVWQFHTVPQPGELGHETYERDEWRDLSGANVWSTMSVDEKNGILFAPTGDLNGHPSGSHLYASSLLALDAATGRLRWYRQITHRDVWDWDLPTPSMLLDVMKDGRSIPAVAITGKHGLFFLFDRLTGAPINGFEERPVPSSAAVWPTQPFPKAPGPIARTQMTRDEIPDLVPGMRAACQQQWDESGVSSEPLYALRQSPDHAVITYPGLGGGANWGGGSYNPQLGLYFINIQNRVVFREKTTEPAVYMHVSPDEISSARPQSPRGRRLPARQPFSFTTPSGINLSCGALPWGELVAIDVNQQRIAWRVPLGMTEALGAEGANTGALNLGGSLATRSGLVFIGATNDRRFRAFDGATGRKLWETELDASAHSTPITYLGKDGKQYVVVAAGGGTAIGGPRISDAVVAFRLP